MFVVFTYGVAETNNFYTFFNTSCSSGGLRCGNFRGVCVFFLSKKETSENNVEVKRFYVVLGFWCFGVLVFNIGC